MDDRAEGSLTQFCISQRNFFAAEEWLARGKAGGKAVAFAAKYLSMTSWYGHEEELEEIASRLYPPLATLSDINTEARSMDFDWSGFSTRVRIGIALELMQQASAPAARSAAQPRLF